MIEKNTIVSLSYVMRNGRGEVLEEKSVAYLHGASAISPALQAQLQGLSAGDHRQLYLEKGQEDADDDFVFDVTVQSVRKATPEELRRGAPLAAIRIHLLSGFLGSGKTTAIREACRLLVKQGIPVAVITNDQGAHLVDGDLFNHLGIPSDQVTNGCFCCRYNELDAAIRSLTTPAFGIEKPAVVFAESVGSCTDLVATVLKPLLQQYPEWHATLTTFADAQPPVDFDDTINYIYNKQLEEAKIIVVSKIDLMEDTTQLKAQMQNRYPEKTILYQNSFDEEHIVRWLETLDTLTFKNLKTPDVDYATYGAGEARLAWLDAALEITSPGNTAQHAALSLIRRLARLPHPIGHLKFLLDGHTKISITAGDPQPSAADPVPAPPGAANHPNPLRAERPAAQLAANYPNPQPAATATLLINARVQTEPAVLSGLVADAIRATERATGCSIRTMTERCFQPGFPRPIHRIP